MQLAYKPVQSCKCMNMYMYMYILYLYCTLLTVGMSLSQVRMRSVFHFCCPLQILPLLYSSTTPPPVLSRLGVEVATPRLTGLLGDEVREGGRDYERMRARVREGERKDEGHWAYMYMYMLYKCIYVHTYTFKLCSVEQ